jgi:uncharacterized protein YjbI with pentapeptide repeats
MKKPKLSRKFILWFVGILALVGISLIMWQYPPVLLWQKICPAATPLPAVAPVDKDQLDLEKAQLEIEKLKSEKSWWWNVFASILPTLVSTLVVIGGGLLGFHKWREDHRIEQAKRDEDYKKEQRKRAEDYQKEQAKLDEERFQKVVEGLGSDRLEARVGAAIMLLTFLRPGYEKFYSQTFLLAVAHLRLRKADPDTPQPLDALSQALIVVFREAFSKARDNIENFVPENLDASGIHMDTAYLSKIDLRKIRVRDAYFRGAVLWKAQLQNSYFKYSDLSGANLSRANLSGADFVNTILKDAKLENANFENAHLSGANLEGAKLKDANPEKAKSLQGTILRNIEGLSAEQLKLCADKGAIIDVVP